MAGGVIAGAREHTRAHTRAWPSPSPVQREAGPLQAQMAGAHFPPESELDVGAGIFCTSRRVRTLTLSLMVIVTGINTFAPQATTRGSAGVYGTNTFFLSNPDLSPAFPTGSLFEFQ